MRPQSDIHTLVRLAVVLALPAMAGCCGSVRTPGKARGDCPPPPPPQCEVNGELVYNLGRGMQTDSLAVSYARNATATVCPWPTAATEGFIPAGAAPAPVCGLPLAQSVSTTSGIAGDGVDIPGVVPVILLVPSADSAPAREIRQDGQATAPATPVAAVPAVATETPAEKQIPAQPADSPETPATRETSSAAPEATKSEPIAEPTAEARIGADIGMAAAPTRAAMIGKYEKLADEREAMPAEPQIPALSGAAEVEEALAGSAAPDSPLPQGELPPSID